MKKKMVSFTLSTLPQLTDAQRANLRSLAAQPEAEIDTFDAPEMSDSQWSNAARSHLHRPIKQQITARVDADVLEWLKAQGKGYQSRINAILRREMLLAEKQGQA